MSALIFTAAGIFAVMVLDTVAKAVRLGPKGFKQWQP